MEKNPAAFRMPQMLGFPHYQSLFGHPKWLAGFFSCGPTLMRKWESNSEAKGQLGLKEIMTRSTLGVVILQRRVGRCVETLSMMFGVFVVL